MIVKIILFFIIKEWLVNLDKLDNPVCLIIYILTYRYYNEYMFKILYYDENDNGIGMYLK